MARKKFEINYEVFGRLAEHFFLTFLSLEGLHFTHAWGGVIEPCSRFSPFFVTTHGGKIGNVLGFTGLSVGSSRFIAMMMLNLLDDKINERTELEMVRQKPVPFPAELFRSLVINLTCRS